MERMRSLRIAAAIAITLALVVSLLPPVRAGAMGALTLANVTTTPADLDRSGHWDTVFVNVSVHVTVAGPFQVTATLLVPVSPTSYQGQQNGTDVNLSVGSHTLSLRFPSDVISAQGSDGPFRVEVQGFVLDSQGFLDPEFDSVSYTPAWTAASFDPPSVSINGTITDQAVDVHGEGRYDELVVHVPVEILRRTVVGVSGTIYVGPYNTPDASAPTPARAYDTGSVVVDLVFDTYPLWASQANGPYNVSIDVTGGYVPPVWHRTQAYSYTTFAGPTATINGLVTTSMVDMNANGKAAALRFDVPVHVRVPGNFTLTAVYLGSSSGLPNLYPERRLPLGAGNSSVDLDYSGIALNRIGVPGNATFQVTLLRLEPPGPGVQSALVTVPGFDPTNFESRSPSSLTVNVTGLPPADNCAGGVALDPATHFLALEDNVIASPTPHFTLYDGTFVVLLDSCYGAATSVVKSITVSGGTTVAVSLPSTAPLALGYQAGLTSWAAGNLDLSVGLSTTSAAFAFEADMFGNRDGFANGSELQSIPLERVAAGLTGNLRPDESFITVDGASLQPQWTEAMPAEGAGSLASISGVTLHFREPLLAMAPIGGGPFHNLTVDVPYSDADASRSLEVDLPAGASGTLAATSHVLGYWGGWDSAGNATPTRSSGNSWSLDLGERPSGNSSSVWFQAAVGAVQGSVPLGSSLFLTVALTAAVAVVAAITAYVLWWSPRRKRRLEPPPPPGSAG